jgi:hypothetical protein
MSRLVSDLTVEELKQIIDEAIDQRIAKVLDDDYGLELSDELVDRIRLQREEIKNGNLGVDLDDVLKEIGIEHVSG